MSSKITQHFRRAVFPIYFVNHRVRCLQSPSLMLRNLRPDLSQLSPLRPYTNSSPSPHASLEESKSSFYMKKSTKYIAKRLRTAISANIKVTGLVGLISVDLLYAWYRNRCNERLLNETVEKGTRPEINVLGYELVSRPLVVDRLKKIFQPHRNHFFNHMIYGEPGSGKTTLTRIASNEVGHGVIYVDVPANFNEFGEAFRKAINFRFDERISFTEQLMRKILGKTNDKLKVSEWERALKAFKRAGAVYKAKHNKPPVIVYDNVGRLVNKNPEILDILQDDAKDNVDDRKYITVFISSEWNVPRRMQARSYCSRAEKPIEIGDLSREESLDYLINKCGIKTVKKGKVDTSEAERLFDLVGGRILDLKCVADKYLEGESIEVIEQNILIEVGKKIRTAKLLENAKHYEVGKRIINALLLSKELSLTTFEEFFNKPEQAKEVLKTNTYQALNVITT
ncbi:10615_t:CDS:2 [Acaulospora morrowiae]|uniref:10615_t:CDS:1 n=1 Tax=Acaulospora morrowiae TaxID=94023 RepID=A0A9N8VMS9_9GLOM|nr:10615_t:CDS:2 [Acaulospora morrowiae]